MKEYKKPQIKDIDVELKDIITESFGNDSKKDSIVTNFWEE